MPQYVEKPIITTLSLNVLPQHKVAFVDWQAKYNAKITEVKGFISLEFLAPSIEQKGWLIVERFASEKDNQAWRHSITYLELIDELTKYVDEEGIDENLNVELPKDSGVTEVIVTQVSPQREKEFREWCAKIHQVEGKFKGFRGVYLQSPTSSQGSAWITLLQFDSMENLDLWLASPERKKIITESGPFISSIETHRIISPYAGWFANIAKLGEIPSVWKQTMIVLMAIFPVVMLEIKYISPLLAHLNPSLSNFISASISVSLLSFILLPLGIRLTSWWLFPKKRKNLPITLFGVLFVCCVYILEILLFWNFLP